MKMDDWRKQEFLNWLCTIKKDRDPPSQKDLAEKLDIDADTLYKWKQNPEFLEAWRVQYLKTIGSPERLNEVMTALYETATDRTDPRQVQAAREYRQAVEGVAPQKFEMTIKKDLREMTDEELNALLGQEVIHEKASRDAEQGR